MDVSLLLLDWHISKLQTIYILLGQTAVINGEITEEHIQIKNEHPENYDILAEFNLECVEEEGRYYFRNPDLTQSCKYYFKYFVSFPFCSKT